MSAAALMRGVQGVATAHLNQAMNTAAAPSMEQQIRAVSREVGGKMGARENANRHNNRPTVCGLYFHFILSLLAVPECAVRLVVHFFMMLVLGLLYYIIYCVSCGEWTGHMSACIAHHTAMYGIYSGLLCGLVSNLCCPWNPPICGYHIRGNTLARPQTQGSPSEWSSRSAMKIDCCCCCGASDAFNVPHYKILKSFFFAFGGFSACSSIAMCCTAPGGGCCAMTTTHNGNGNAAPAVVEDGQAREGRLSAGYIGYMQRLLREVAQENAEDTRQFYQQEYQCSSFEELIQRRLGVHLGGNGGGGGGGGRGTQNPVAGGGGQQPVYAAAMSSSSGQPVQGYVTGPQAVPVAKPVKPSRK